MSSHRVFPETPVRTTLLFVAKMAATNDTELGSATVWGLGSLFDDRDFHCENGTASANPGPNV